MASRTTDETVPPVSWAKPSQALLGFGIEADADWEERVDHTTLYY
jgi:hypothetical protein